LVCLSEHGRPGLLENVEAGELGGFDSDIDIHDAADG
jgi:hypothetical protein